MNSAGWRDGQQMSGVEEFRLDGMWSDMRHATRAFEGVADRLNSCDVGPKKSVIQCVPSSGLWQCSGIGGCRNRE